MASNRYYPGWTATLNGRHEVMYRAFGVMQALPIPPGVAMVHFQYDGAAWRWGYFCSIGGVAVLAILLGLEMMPGWGEAEHLPDGRPAA